MLAVLRRDSRQFLLPDEITIRNRDTYVTSLDTFTVKALAMGMRACGYAAKKRRDRLAAPD